MTRAQYAEAYVEGHNRTVGLLISKGLSEDEASETAQAAWARGWERQNQLRDRGKALTWVNSIALNLYRNHYRFASRNEEFQDIPVRPEFNLAAIDVHRLLARCDRCSRDLLVKRYLQDCDIGQLAEEYGCSRTAVRVRLVRARKCLRQMLDRGPRRCLDPAAEIVRRWQN